MLHALTKAIRLTKKLQDVGPMSEPIEECAGQSFIAEDLRPVSKV